MKFEYIRYLHKIIKLRNKTIEKIEKNRYKEDIRLSSLMLEKELLDLLITELEERIEYYVE